MMNKDQRLRNIFYLLLSIIVAAGIWYYVDESSGRIVFQTVWDIPIEYTGEAALADNGLMLVEGDDSGTSTTVDITYRGTRRHIVQLDRSKVRVTADLSGITSAGVQTVNITPSYTDRGFNQSMKTHIAEVFAFKCTELPGTIIDARGAGISPEGSSGWQRMVHGQSHNVSCFDGGEIRL